MKNSSLSLLCVFVLGACCCCKGSSPKQETKPETAKPAAPAKVGLIRIGSELVTMATIEHEIPAQSSQANDALHR